MYIMSINASKDLVFSRENGKIMAGGYKINSTLLEGGRSLCGITQGGDRGGAAGAGSILNGLAVPFGLLVAQQELGKKINTKKISTNKVVDGGLYDKLVDLAKITNKKELKGTVDRGTVDNGTVDRGTVDRGTVERKKNKTKKNKDKKDKTKKDKKDKKDKTKKDKKDKRPKTKKSR